MKKRMALLATLGVMAVIFFFSSQPAEVSGALSYSVEQSIRGTGAEYFIPEWFSPNSFANVRKWAHVYIFLALGVCMTCTVQGYRPAWNGRKQGLVSGIVCILYAVSDEVHQYFVPGRAMLAEDVLVDAIGVCLGVLAVFLISFLWHCRKKQS